MAAREERCGAPVHWGRMGLFAAMMTYVAAVLLLAGGMVTATALFFTKPAAIEGPLVEKPRAPLQRAADRQAAEALKFAPSSKAAPKPQSGADTSAVNRPPAPAPQVKAAEPAKRLADEPRRKKKVAKPAPAASPPASDPDSAALGYNLGNPPKPRKFVFPLDPEW
jgi:hypothetical protein